MDRVSAGTRSKIMTAVKPYGNKTTELKMVRILRDNALKGYRRHWPVVGKPDFAWPKRKVALFVDGCFWHGCSRCKKMPASNVEFWEKHIGANRRRDRRVNYLLRKAGWRVIRVWECSLDQKQTRQRIRAILSTLQPRR